jgi:Protein of unknown function (DUF3999)
MKRRFLALVTLVPLAAIAASAALNDYRRGLELTVPPGKPLAELDLPDVVYENITRTDLADINVFNDAEQSVPHTLCAAAAWSTPAVETKSLPVFELHAGDKRSPSTSNVAIDTAAGTHVRIEESGARGIPPTNGSVQAYVIDGRNVDRDMRALTLGWESADGASEAQVRVEASNDLDRWRELVGTSTLLKTHSDNGSLRRERIPLPQGRYQYLRLERADGGAALRVTSVTAELVVPIQRVEPRWFSAQRLPASPESSGVNFDAGRLAAVTFGRVRLARENSSVRIEIYSRAKANETWHLRWEGEVYSILADGAHRETPAVDLASTTDRYWQLRSTDPAALNSAQPTIDLGYYPLQLRFLAQGEGPFTLAFGSARAESAMSAGCGTLLANLSVKEAADLTAVAQAGRMRELGGELALKPRAKPTPTRLIVLWATLLGGAVAVALMAMSLLKRVRKSE